MFEVINSIDTATAATVNSFSLAPLQFSSIAETVMRRDATRNGLRSYLAITEQVAHDLARLIPVHLDNAISFVKANAYDGLGVVAEQDPFDAEALLHFAQDSIANHYDNQRLHYARMFRNALLTNDPAARYHVGEEQNPLTQTRAGHRMPSTDWLALTVRKLLVDWVNQARVASLQHRGDTHAQVVSEDNSSSHDGTIFRIGEFESDHPSFGDVADSIFHPRTRALVGGLPDVHS